MIEYKIDNCTNRINPQPTGKYILKTRRTSDLYMHVEFTWGEALPKSLLDKVLNRTRVITKTEYIPEWEIDFKEIFYFDCKVA